MNNLDNYQDLPYTNTSGSLEVAKSTMPDVISVPAAAEEKGCSRQTIYNALDRGALNEHRTGKTRLVVQDKKYDEWEVKAKHRENSNE